MRKYGKTIAELGGALIMAFILTYQELAGNGVTSGEWVLVVIALFGVINVWATANIAGWGDYKLLVSGIFVVLNLVVGFLTDNRLSGDEIMILIVQFLSTLGVAVSPAPDHEVAGSRVAR
jgi:hypothetical protein